MPTTAPAASSQAPVAREPGNSVQPEGVSEDGEQSLDSVALGFAVLVDLGSAMAGLRELAEQKDLIGLGTSSSHVEAVEAVVIDMVEMMGVGARLTEAVAAGVEIREPNPGEPD